MRRTTLSLLLAFGVAGCGASRDGVGASFDRGDERLIEARFAPPPREPWATGAPAKRFATTRIGAPSDEPSGEPGRGASVPDGAGGPFRNTYYDFPSDAGGSGQTLYDSACKPIADVGAEFHDALCVQGSGKLAGGGTVSFAKRDCACASVCPRTGQKICFEKLDPTRFPWGRGAMGRAITPLRTIAVDPSVIPLGSRVFIAELEGLPLPGGGTHDGCFVAEDRGARVVGEHVDVFTGDPATTALYNGLYPSNRGVHVSVDDPRCGGRSGARASSSSR